MSKVDVFGGNVLVNIFITLGNEFNEETTKLCIKTKTPRIRQQLICE